MTNVGPQTHFYFLLVLHEQSQWVLKKNKKVILIDKLFIHNLYLFISALILKKTQVFGGRIGVAELSKMSNRVTIQCDLGRALIP